jgi:hypothetical protein
MNLTYMNRSCILIIGFIFFYNAVAAQIVLSVSPSLSVHSLDYSDTQLAAVQVMPGDSSLIILSDSDTGLATSNDSIPVKKNNCVISFIGFDENYAVIPDFLDFFYSEYLSRSDAESAFYKARTYLFNKYPNSPVTPVIRVKK